MTYFLLSKSVLQIPLCVLRSRRKKLLTSCLSTSSCPDTNLSCPLLNKRTHCRVGRWDQDVSVCTVGRLCPGTGINKMLSIRGEQYSDVLLSSLVQGSTCAEDIASEARWLHLLYWCAFLNSEIVSHLITDVSKPASCFFLIHVYESAHVK